MNRIEAARYLAECHSSDDNVSVDDDAEVNPVPNGIHVQAWIFIRNEDIDSFLSDENNIPPALR